MGRRGALAVDGAGRAAPERPSRSGARREADRARAVLWSPEGGTGAAVAARPGVRAERARRSRPRPGRTPREREAALAAAGGPPEGSAADRPAWTPARLAAEVAARAGGTV